MNFASKALRDLRLLEMSRSRGYPVGDKQSSLSNEDKQALAEGILKELEVQEFLDQFPYEEQAVFNEITEFVAGLGQTLSSPSDRSEKETRERQIAKLRADFLKELLNKVRRYYQVAEALKPFRQYLGSAWDLSSGILHPSVFDIWRESDRILKTEARIKDIARRLGRLDEVERAVREKRMLEIATRDWTFERAGRSTLVGIHESDDLASLISTEVAMLSTPETEELFYLKFAEKKLLTYDYATPENSSRSALQRKVRRPERGPLILVLDTSGSMQGEKERQAKAFALSLIRIAFRQERNVHIITFSSDVRTLTLRPPRASLREILDFLMLSYHGGTDIGQALESGISALGLREFQRADLIFLTDAQVSAFSSGQIEAMNAAREKGTRFYGLVMGAHEDPEFFKHLDEVWRYEGKNLRNVVRDLEAYGEGKNALSKLRPQIK